MRRETSTKKSKFKKCPSCGTETVLATCYYCGKQLVDLKQDLSDLLDSKAAKRRARKLAREKQNDEEEK